MAMMHGAQAEDVACALLRARGCRIVARNWRTRAGEVDVIARQGDVLLFVEVKARTGDEYGGAAAAVTVAKQRRIIRAASAFMAQTECDLPARFDVITVSPAGVQLHRDAFQVDDPCSQRS